MPAVQFSGSHCLPLSPDAPPVPSPMPLKLFPPPWLILKFHHPSVIVLKANLFQGFVWLVLFFPKGGFGCGLGERGGNSTRSLKEGELEVPMTGKEAQNRKL